MFDDPTVSIIHSFNEMLFRAAIISSSWSNLSSLVDPGIIPNQTTSANQTVTGNVFHSDFRWYAAAVSLEILVVLVVLTMYWGSWTLNDTLDLSPFDFALAFNSPLLSGMGVSKGATEVVEKYGDVRIRYTDLPGDLEDGGSVKTSGFVRVAVEESKGDQL